MFKFIGISLLLLASFAAGCLLAYQIRQRVEELIYLRKLMFIFKGELEYKNAMLPDAFKTVASKAKGPYDELFYQLAVKTEENFSKPISALFSEKIDAVLSGNSYLKAADLNLFKELGETLGFQNQKMQLNNIDLYIDRLSNTIEEERDKMEQEVKVYRTLAMMTGVLVSIVLI